MNVSKSIFLVLVLLGAKILLDLKFGNSIFGFATIKHIANIYNDFYDETVKAYKLKKTKEAIIMDLNKLQSANDVVEIFYKYQDLFDPDNAQTIHDAITHFKNIPGAIESVISGEKDEGKLHGPIACAVKYELYTIAYEEEDLPPTINITLSNALHHLRGALVAAVVGDIEISKFTITSCKKD